MIRIRPATSDDLGALALLERDALDDPWSEAGLRSELDAAHGRVYIAESAHDVAGSLCGWVLDGAFHLNRIAVARESRQRGVGRRLVRHALRLAACEGAQRALLEVRADNQAALALYRSFGFVTRGQRRRYYPDGTDALLLEAPLEPWQRRELASGVYAILDIDRVVAGFGLDVAHLTTYAAAAVHAGAVALQLRWKALPVPHPVRTEVVRVVAAAVGDEVPIFVNDDVEAAAACRDLPHVGLHLGQGDAAPTLARQALGPEAWLGWSSHTLPEVTAAASLCIDCLGFGPVRATATKADAAPAVGIGGLQQAVQATRHAVVAIGGLQARDLASVRGAGARAVAVIGAWLGPDGRPHTPAEAGAAVARLTDAWHAAGPREPGDGR
ncbi:MAG: ribosomal-protein-alanine N-acetyltransferase [Myxococcales bacterium]|nr:ribosomal-protein-alanine N-acetyltransferase [Myxococcales bacterium]